MLALAALLPLGLASLVAAAPVEKRGGDRFTFYYTDVGLGACGSWHANTEFTVAMNSAQFAAGGNTYNNNPICGKTISISYGGKTATATVQDECPTCPYGGLDLSPSLFSYFADQGAGVIYGDWSMGGSAPAAATTAASVSLSTSSSSGSLKYNGQCLAVSGSWNDGAWVVYEDCSGSGAEQWSVTQGATGQVKLAGTNYCLDGGANSRNGNQAQIWTCNGSSQQNWFYTGDNRLAISGGNQCLDAKSGGSGKVQTYKCSTGNARQAWTN